MVYIRHHFGMGLVCMDLEVLKRMNQGVEYLISKKCERQTTNPQSLANHLLDKYTSDNQYILLSQSFPINPGRHSQENEVSVLVQVASFLHGLESHGFGFGSKSTIKYSPISEIFSPLEWSQQLSVRNQPSFLISICFCMPVF